MPWRFSDEAQGWMEQQISPRPRATVEMTRVEGGAGREECGQRPSLF